MARYRDDEDDHHPACRCGCGELADECSGPRPNPFGSMTITTPDPNPYHPRGKRTGTTRRVQDVALPEPSSEEARLAAWATYRQLHPEVLASWGESNGRWPHPSEMPPGYVRPDSD